MLKSLLSGFISPESLNLIKENKSPIIIVVASQTAV